MSSNSSFRFLFPALLIVAATQAQAHIGQGAVGGFWSGFFHPLFGLDHIVAMVGVGLWGAFLGAPAIWLLPVVFPLVMSFGGMLGIVGVPIPGGETVIETGIALSGIVLGAAVLFGIRAPNWVAAIIVGLFAICHGYAHGAEMPGAANAFSFAIGFVVATGMLHMCGIALGFLTLVPKGQYLVRALGGGICLVGGGFLFGFL
jgi:urease accessory protein